MDNGKWITINGRHIFLKEGQSPMDAFIRKQKGPTDYAEGDLKESNSKYEFKDGKIVKVKETTKYVNADGSEINFINEKDYKVQTKEFYDSLNEEEKNTLYKYISEPSWFYSTNPIYVNNNGKENIKIVNDIFKNKAKTFEKDTLVFRRSYETEDEIIKGFKKEKMISTSAYDKLPKTMPSGKSFGETELYIIVPKGIKYLPVEKVGTDYVASDKGEKLIFARQHELLLEPNLEFELVKNKSEIHKGYYQAYKDNKYKYVVKVRK